jgi:hypothetical protein
MKPDNQSAEGFPTSTQFMGESFSFETAYLLAQVRTSFAVNP